MTKKLLGVFTAVVAALAVVGVAWAGTDAGTSTSIAATASTEATVDDTTGVTADDSASTTNPTTVVSSTSTSVDDHGTDDSNTTSTSHPSTTSTSIAGTTSTSIDDDDDDTSTTSTTIDDNNRIVVPDGVTTHAIPGVGTVTIQASGGQLFLVSVSAPGWTVERQRVEVDRIRIELISGEAEAEFEARIDDGKVEVKIEVDSD